MAILDIFSKRKQKLQGKEPDVFSYDDLPNALRVQIVHVLRDGFGENSLYSSKASEIYECIENSLAREYGKFSLGNKQESKSNVENFILNETETEKVLDALELSLQIINGYVRDNRDYRDKTTNRSDPDKVIEEMNSRFREHAIGYRFESDEILRIDSEIIHQEATKPALKLLADNAFKGANQEFLEAHEHYRHSRNKECLVSSLKSLESTVRVICTQRAWKVEENSNASKLIATIFANGLLPTHLESQFSALRSLLESGIPTIRNKNGGHGQGSDVKEVPEFIARYALNLTASSIVFLVDASRS